MRMYESFYTEFMREKIQQLPLPPILKRYLNFYRDFKKPGQEYCWIVMVMTGTSKIYN